MRQFSGLLLMMYKVFTEDTHVLYLVILRFINKTSSLIANTKRFALICCLSLVVISPVSFSKTIEPDIENGSLRIDTYVDVLIDKESSLSIEKILTPDTQYQFKPSNTDSLNFGFSQSSYWFKIDLNNPTNQKLLLDVNFPLLDVVELYIPDKNGEQYSAVKTGDKHPFSTREIRNSTFVFKLPEFTDKITLYLHIYSAGGATQVPLLLWTEDAFYNDLANNRTWLGIYYGILFVMGLYNLFLFLFIRDKNYLFYTVYIVTFSLLQLSLDGLAYEYLWPNSIWLGSNAPAIFLSLSMISIFMFSRHFLLTKKFTPVLDKVFKVLISACLLTLAVSLFYDFSIGTQFSTFMGLILSALILPTGIKIFFQGYRPARYFLLAWAGFIIGIAVNVLLYYAVLPLNMVTGNAMRIGSMLEAILFSLAIADRLLILQKVHDKTESRIKQQLSNLNIELEKRVLERTEELSSANAKLAEMNVHLQQLALMDDLTDLMNHRTFVNRLTVNLEEAYRYKYPISIIMIDLDYFKMVNDCYGHQVGDDVLVRVSKVIKSTLRSSDLGARYGGEEFVIMLSHTAISEAKLTAERLHDQVSKLKFPGADELKVTASFGIACTEGESRNLDVKELIRRADNSLYQAKEAGRNQIKVYESAESEEEIPV